METAASEITQIIQTTSINRAPSVEHDVNPSTAASSKRPVQVRQPSHFSSPPSSPSAIPLTARAVPRSRAMPPLPDMRFEQSYLASLPPGASRTRIVYITIRDQVLSPLIQGMAWTLILSGWRHWNRGAQMVGEGVGARLRRWWWRVNKWDVPVDARGKGRR